MIRIDSGIIGRVSSVSCSADGLWSCLGIARIMSWSFIDWLLWLALDCCKRVSDPVLRGELVTPVGLVSGFQRQNEEILSTSKLSHENISCQLQTKSQTCVSTALLFQSVSSYLSLHCVAAGVPQVQEPLCSSCLGSGQTGFTYKALSSCELLSRIPGLTVTCP